MTEQELQQAIIDLCQWRGLAVYHTHDSRRSQPGFPDLVIAGARVLFRELKSDRGKLTAEQAAWGGRLLRAGADWSVWRPADWRSGLIQRELQGIGGARHA